MPFFLRQRRRSLFRFNGFFSIFFSLCICLSVCLSVLEQPTVCIHFACIYSRSSSSSSSWRLEVLRGRRRKKECAKQLSIGLVDREDITSSRHPRRCRLLLGLGLLSLFFFFFLFVSLVCALLSIKQQHRATHAPLAFESRRG